MLFAGRELRVHVVRVHLRGGTVQPAAQGGQVLTRRNHVLHHRDTTRLEVSTRELHYLQGSQTRKYSH